MQSPILTIISFIVIFTVVVVSHEFGHFMIAKLNGIKVNEFSIGMGPAIFKKKGKETTLAIRLFPIGGACIFEGEDGIYQDEDEPGKPKEIKEGTFSSAPVWGRIATVFAGPFFNIILAYLLSMFLCWFCGADTPVLYDVSENYPAQAAGLEAGDTIISIDHQRIFLWREVSVISYMNHGEPIDITYERDGQRYDTTITPMYSEEDSRYYIGFIGGGNYVECNNLSVFKYSFYEVRYWIVTTVRSLVYMVSGYASADDVAGPVGIATVIDDTIEETSKEGVFTVFLNMVNIALLLSVNLGVLNLLPVPALDGGRLLFLLFEAITKKKVPPEKEGIVHLIGFVILMILMVLVLYNDIMRLIR